MTRPAVLFCLFAVLLAGCADRTRSLTLQERATAAEVDARVPTKPFLNMPQTAQGEIPRLLSQTGAFADVRALTPVRGAVPYDLVLAFWSDGAEKARFVAIPEGKVAFTPDGDWGFPRGTVFVKTFLFTTDTAHPEAKRRLETRLLVLDGKGAAYGVTYKWRADLSDADLIGSDGLKEDLTIHGPSGSRTQTWAYPSRKDCVTCHNDHTTGVLGPKTRQMNRDFAYSDGTENQLRHWSRLGLFPQPLDDKAIASFVTLARPDDTSRSLEDRARSYLDANCSQCHRPGETVANFDARFQTPLDHQELVEGPVLINLGIDRPRVISPHDPWRSMIIRRAFSNDDARMPPIARMTVDEKGMALIRQWILSMPGKDVIAPPTLSPAGGEFAKPISVALASDVAGAQIHYTVDGSTPGTDDPVYDKPIRVEGPTVLRARAYKDGMTRSLVVQQTYLVGQ